MTQNVQCTHNTAPTYLTNITKCKLFKILNKNDLLEKDLTIALDLKYKAPSKAYISPLKDRNAMTVLVKKAITECK